MERALEIRWLGRIAYTAAIELQEQEVLARRAGARGDVLLLLEHPPVITLGRGADERHLRVPREVLAAQGIEVHRVSRGGDVTWHGPGQLVGYPILDLAARGEPDVVRHLRRLEAVLVRALAAIGVPATTRPRYTGVFVDDPAPGPARKIASIGVGVRGWVTYHGFALNVTADLAAFDPIVPCGLHDVGMTSVARELGRKASGELFDSVRERVAEAFRAGFA